MSFSSEVKKEMVSVQVLSECCRHAEAYGLLLFGRSFSSAAVSFAAENRAVSEKYASCVRQITGIEPEYSDRPGKMAIVSVKTAVERRTILNAFGHTAGELSLRINRANLTDECCFAAFIRGVFLACGSVSSPEKNYHLEFVVPFLKLSNDLFSFLQELGFMPKHIMRKGYHIIYFKDSANIEDLLTLMGATNATLRLIGVKVDKDMRNHVNRRVNFETANIDRSVQAGGLQVEAIRKIAKARGLDSLPQGLREIAQIRLDNPEATLYELEELFGGRLSRSGINHRLKRLEQIAAEL